MRRSAFALAALALPALALAAAASAGPAEAAKRKSNEITVQARSYFDAGNVVKPGTGGYTNYVSAGNNSTAAPFAANRSGFGGETLPGRWDLPNCCGVTVDIPAGPLGKR